MKRVLHLLQGILFAGALCLLSYCAFVLVDTRIFQNAQSRQLESLLNARSQAHLLPASAVSGMIGRLDVPRLGLSAIVIEGTAATTLRRAAGHISGTAMPGEPGNVGISGHRDTFFRPLRNIRKNDVITVTTLRGEYRYRVLSTKVVGPFDVAVLNPGPDEVLTLVTCYPFYFVGPAPQRFIVRAERVI